jgi:hypothetical protein
MYIMDRGVPSLAISYQRPYKTFPAAPGRPVYVDAPIT